MSKKNKEYKAKAKKALENHTDINCEKCGAVGSEHSCPYAEEMSNDGGYYACTCCKKCTKQCCDDI